MSLKEIPIKKSYDSDIDNILLSFYIPALSVAIEYFRLTGFFSSTAFAVAAKGLSSFIRNGGTMKLVTSARFEEEDLVAIKDACESPEKIIEERMLKDLENLETEFVRDHVRALAWMLKNRRLKVKVAMVVSKEGSPMETTKFKTGGIFHQKVGILIDLDGNMISFSGSDNESGHGWQSNIEEFKVFRNWDPAEKEYFESDLIKFERFWNGNSVRTITIDLPKAVEQKLLEIAPKNIEEINLEKWEKGETKTEIPKLRDYQLSAINAWLSNGRRGIFEMATGTGKTITAIACLQSLLKSESSLITIISSPFIHLSEQWIGELDRFGILTDKLICDSDQTNWRDKLVDNILDVQNGITDGLLVLTTHSTLASEDFVSIIQKSKKWMPNQKYFLISDEVHAIGAPIRQTALLQEYDYRLGLSATPKRWFDEEGTKNVFEYFGDVVYRFSLEDAINAGFLTPYIYKPYFATLSEEELGRYEAETRKLSKAYYCAKDDLERGEIFTLLCIKRQKIIRNASSKMTTFENILDTISDIKHCLIYCSPQQIVEVQEILNKRNIVQHKFTEKEGTKPEIKYDGLSERELLLQRFSEGTYRALVSMKCLDEGVDIPPARLAIMLDNSGNPREYIQRRGRVLRKFSGKDKAVIFDIIVEPTLKTNLDKSLASIEKKIISKELLRVREFAKSSVNFEECLKKMNNLESKYGLS